MNQRRWLPGARYRMLRPRETKEYGIPADYQTPTVQLWGGAVPVRIIVYLLALSWVVILPPVIPWTLGMLFAVTAPVALWWYALAWVLKWMEPTQAERAFVAHLLSTIVVIACSASFAYHVVWDWWATLCYESGFFGVPTPHLEGGNIFLPIGILLAVVGGVIILLWKPRFYLVAVQIVGAIVAIGAWSRDPLSLHWTHGATNTLTNGDIIFYGVWGAICAAVYLSTPHYLARMDKEMEDDYPYEHGEPKAPKTVTQTKYQFIPASPGRALSPPDAPPAVISTFNGKDDTLVRVDEFIEFIYLVQRKGTFAREKLFPYKFACSGRKVAQWAQWVELIFPLEPDVYNRATKEIQPEYALEDGTLDAENVIAMMSLGGHAS